MSLNERLIGVGAAACTTDSVNPFGQGSGVALYTLDYDASDAGGLYDGTPTNVEFGVAGQINYGAGFNGSSSKIFLTSTGTSVTDYDSDFSVSMWVYMKNLPHAASQDHLWTGGGTRIIPMSINTDGKVLIDFFSGSSNSVTSTTALTLNGWTHLVMTRSKTNGVKFYLDGSESGTSTYTGNASSLSQRDTIGSYWDGTRMSFDGSIDQIRIFSKALSQSEVDTLYAETACVYTATTTDNYFPLADGSSDAVAYYKLDNSAEDSVGLNDGTETDIEYRFGRFAQAAVFNGSSSKIVTGINSLTNTFAVSMWINPASFSVSRWVFNNWNSTTQDITWVLKTDGTFDLLIDGGNTRFFGSSGDITINTWHHVVLTMDSGNYEVYLDSVSLGTGSTTNTTFANGQFYQIGSSPKTSASASRFDGSIDQVRIYSTALDSNQVSQLYNEKPETDTSNFKAVLYKGTSSKQYISNVGMDLETGGGLVWIKNRDQADNNTLVDSVRGISTSGTKYIASNTTDAEDTSTNLPVSLEKNGFFVQGVAGITNTSGEDYVSWVWKGGGDDVLNGQGDIPSQVSANTEAGFSIVKYVGNGVNSSLQKVGTGLNQECDIVIIKSLNNVTAASWVVQRNKTDVNKYLYLNDTRAESTSTAFNVDINTNEGTFGFTSNNLGVNQLNQNYIAYCWHSVSGYSKIGSYEGNGTTRNVDLGFNPNWIMIKNTDTAATAWNIVDTRRDTDTTLNLFLQANTNIAESNTTICSLITDGFSVTGTNTFNNSSGDTFIYMAFK